MRESYFAVSRRFYNLLVLVQLWALGVDVLAGEGFTRVGIFNVAMAILALVLAISRSNRTHSIGTSIAWVLMVAALALGGLGVSQ